MAAVTNGWLATLSVSLSACVLVVPAPNADVTATCMLTQSESTACGRCVASDCQDALNACCAAGSACEPAIDNLVACQIFETCEPEGTSSEERALRRCAAQTCAEECNLDPVADGGSDAGSKGAKVCEEAGEHCSCEVVADETARGTCKPFNLRDEWLCCASRGYPEVGTTCGCRPVQCVELGVGVCACGVVVAHREGSTYVSSCFTRTGTCCAKDGACDCDDGRDRCESGTTSIRSCDVYEVTCAGSTEVTSCSP